MLNIYTDGSCLKNPGGPGGWSFVIVKDDLHHVVSGGEIATTNNRMELCAVIEALKYISEKECIIYSDSQWVIKCATKVWKRHANLDLWKLFDTLSLEKHIEWKWVKAHNGNKYNEIADKFAYMEALRNKNL